MIKTQKPDYSFATFLPEKYASDNYHFGYINFLVIRFNVNQDIESANEIQLYEGDVGKTLRLRQTLENEKNSSTQDIVLETNERKIKKNYELIDFLKSDFLSKSLGIKELGKPYRKTNDRRFDIVSNNEGTAFLEFDRFANNTALTHIKFRSNQTVFHQRYQLSLLNIK